MSTNQLRPTRWMGWLFAVGSTCFAVGVPLSVWLPSQPVVAAVVYFLGSVFFTSAATVQMWLARKDLPALASLPPVRRLLHLLGYRAPAWSSSWIQWLGTLAFNVTTWRGVLAATDPSGVTPALVWRPDAVGSVLFLVSSAIAMHPEVRRFRHSHVRNRSWTIAFANLVGSVFFGLSAVGAFPEPSGEAGVWNLLWANAGTLLGALCFLLGALLVLPPGRAGRVAQTP
jgi:hypothetical protein